MAKTNVSKLLKETAKATGFTEGISISQDLWYTNKDHIPYCRRYKLVIPAMGRATARKIAETVKSALPEGSFSVKVDDQEVKAERYTRSTTARWAVVVKQSLKSNDAEKSEAEA